MLQHTHNVNTRSPSDPVSLLSIQRIIAATIIQLVKLRELSQSQDPSFDGWQYYLTTQFVQNLSVITACIPYIKNLLLGLESGFFQTGHFHLQKPTAINGTQGWQRPDIEGRTIGPGSAHSRHANLGDQPILESHSGLELRSGEDSRLSAQSQNAETIIEDNESQASRAKIIKKASRLVQS